LGQLDADLVGKLCLLMVALLWGSYNPMLKVLYAQDGPPGPVAVMLFRGVIQAGVLLAAYTWATRGTSNDGSQEAGDSQQQQQQMAAAAAAEQQPGSSSGGLAGWWADQASNVPFTAIAASELGLWLFMATGIQTVGLQLTTATRAGFLIQATALLTPLLASFSGQKPSRNVWIGCMIALAGCLCIAADASAVDADDAAAFSLAGDAAILSSAFFFSLATVRLGTYARAIPAVELAAAKSLVLGGIAVGTFGVAAAALAAEGAPLSDLWPGYDNPLSWGIMIWSALGPGAAAAFLHAKGQSVVPPADAQVIFSTTPLWSVAFAFLLLGGEPLSSYTVAGGAAVVAAGVVASRKEEGADDKNGKQA
jgi:drug/metabolite transporter (DMT)-like permease